MEKQLQESTTWLNNIFVFFSLFFLIIVYFELLGGKNQSAEIIDTEKLLFEEFHFWTEISHSIALSMGICAYVSNLKFIVQSVLEIFADLENAVEKNISCGVLITERNCNFKSNKVECFLNESDRASHCQIDFHSNLLNPRQN